VVTATSLPKRSRQSSKRVPPNRSIPHSDRVSAAMDALSYNQPPSLMQNNTSNGFFNLPRLFDSRIVDCMSFDAFPASLAFLGIILLSWYVRVQSGFTACLESRLKLNPSFHNREMYLPIISRRSSCRVPSNIFLVSK
jgi:hypothetical protein